MPNNVVVSITADVADLRAKMAVASAELRTTTKTLNDLAKSAQAGVTPELAASLLSAGEAAAKAQNKVVLFKREMASISAGGGAGVAGTVEKALGGLKAGALQQAISGLGSFGLALGALGPAGIAAAVAIGAFALSLEKAQQAVDAAAAIQKLATTVGVSTDFIQKFNFALRQNDIDLEAGDESLQAFNVDLGLVQSGLARTMQVKAFAAVGFTPEQLRQYHDAGELFPVLADRIAAIGNAAEQAAVAKRLGLESLLPMIRNTTSSFGDLSAEAKRLGIVMDAGAVKKAIEAKEKLNELDDVMKAKEMITFARFEDLLISFKGAWASFHNAGLEALDAIGQHAHEAEQAIASLKSTLGFVMNKMSKGSGDALQHQARQTLTPPPAPPAEQPGSRDKAATNLAGDTGKKGGGEKDQVEAWREALHQMEIASGDFFKDQTANELAFWQGKLALTKKGSKDWLAVQSEIFDASKTLAHRDYDEHLAGLAAKAEADKNYWAKYRADLQAELDYVASKQGAGSEPYLQKQREIEQADREHQDKMVADQIEADDRALKSYKDRLDSQMSIQETQASAQKALNDAKGASSILGPLGGVQAATADAAQDRQLQQQKIANAEAFAAATLAKDQRTMDLLEAQYGQDQDHWAKAQQAKLADSQMFQQQIAQLQTEAAAKQIEDQLKIQQAWHSAIDPMVDSFGSGIKGMIEGTENFRQAMRGVADTILGTVISAIERWIAAQIVGAILGQAVGTQSAKSQVLAMAGLAAAGGVASMAAAPFPLDLGAPAFGEAMFDAAMAFGSFDKGVDAMPADAIVQVHAGERIVPASDNRQMIAALASRGTDNTGGDSHYHFNSTINGVGDPDVIGHLQRHQGEFVRLMKNLHRGGHWR